MTHKKVTPASPASPVAVQKLLTEYFDSERCHRSSVIVVATVNDLQHYHFPNTMSGLFEVKLSPLLNEADYIEVEFIHSTYENGQTIAFEGLWIAAGAQVGTRYTGNKPLIDPDSGRAPPCESHAPRKMYIESFISSLAMGTDRTEPVQSAQVGATLPSRLARHLDKEYGLDIKCSQILLPLYTCLTRSCEQTSHYVVADYWPIAKDLYFRSGWPNTPLFHIPWKHAANSSPSLIILEFGFWDYHQYLINYEHHNHHAIRSFTQEFVTSYVDFILTIRRNLPRGLQSSQLDADESYLYHSQPSTTPIVLLNPILPSRYNPLLQSELLFAIRKIINHLRYFEGDTNTFSLDTSGWLSTSDFVPATVNTPKSAQLQNPQDGTRRDGKTKQAEILSIPVPRPESHEKLAYILSLHLCPHLESQHHLRPFSKSEQHSAHADVQLNRSHNQWNSSIATFQTGPEDNQRTTKNEKSICPFQVTNTAYTGKLHIPAEADIDMILEERKIERVKALFGPYL